MKLPLAIATQASGATQFNMTTSSTTSRLKSRFVFPLASRTSTTTWISFYSGVFSFTFTAFLDPHRSTFNRGPLIGRIVILVTFRICHLGTNVVKDDSR